MLFFLNLLLPSRCTEFSRPCGPAYQGGPLAVLSDHRCIFFRPPLPNIWVVKSAPSRWSPPMALSVTHRHTARRRRACHVPDKLTTQLWFNRSIRKAQRQECRSATIPLLPPSRPQTATAPSPLRSGRWRDSLTEVPRPAAECASRRREALAQAH